MSKFLQFFRKKQQHKTKNSLTTPSSASKKDNSNTQLKVNIVNVFNQQQQVTVPKINSNLKYNSSEKRIHIFEEILSAPVVSIDKLKVQSWNGIPRKYRSLSWKILLKYCPTNQQNINISLQKKRKDYHSMVETYIQKPTLEQDAQQKKIYKLICDDVMRTLPQAGLFRSQIIQKIMRRILYIWHIRHPLSGYVQGINDTVTPFIIVYLGDYIKLNYDMLQIPESLQSISREHMDEIQGDCYWCLCKILQNLLDNYNSDWSGRQKSFVRIKQIIKRIDIELLLHFEKEGIDLYHVYFKWINCLLLRQFNIKIGLRLFDTYIANQNNYYLFIIYILIAILLKYSKKIKKMGFQDIMVFLQNMPTYQWNQENLATVIAEAFVYQNYFVK